jgi:hypothetical protein
VTQTLVHRVDDVAHVVLLERVLTILFPHLVQERINLIIRHVRRPHVDLVVQTGHVQIICCLLLVLELIMEMEMRVLLDNVKDVVSTEYVVMLDQTVLVLDRQWD